MDPVTAGIIIEIAKSLVIVGFTQMRMAGLNDEEIKKYANDVHALFVSLPSATTLPEVPK
jgi:hypothetical protein